MVLTRAAAKRRLVADDKDPLPNAADTEKKVEEVEELPPSKEEQPKEQSPVENLLVENDAEKKTTVKEEPEQLNTDDIFDGEASDTEMMTTEEEKTEETMTALEDLCADIHSKTRQKYYSPIWVPVIKAIDNFNHVVSRNGYKMHEELCRVRRIGKFLLKEKSKKNLGEVLSRVYDHHILEWTHYVEQLAEVDMTEIKALVLPLSPFVPPEFDLESQPVSKLE